MSSETRRLRRAAARAEAKAVRRRKGMPTVKIDMLAPITNYAGDPIVEQGEAMTLRNAIWVALNNIAPNENIPGDEKLRRYRITNAAFRDAVLDLSLEDASFLKEKSGTANLPLVHGRLVDALEPPEAQPEVEVVESSNGQADDGAKVLAAVHTPTDQA